MSQPMLEYTEPEAYEPGEAADEAWGEDATSDARRRARQRQIMLARQRQAQLRVPERARRRELDLETKVALDSLRRRLHEAHRLAYRNAWAAEASAAASQVLDSFEDGLEPHDWARALIRGAPTLLLSPGKPTKPGLQGFFFDPRVGGGAVIAAIWAIGHFRGAARGINSITVAPNPVSLSLSDATKQTVTLAAMPVDRNGNPVHNVTVTWSSLDSAIAVVDPNTGKCTLPSTHPAEGTTTFITANDGKGHTGTTQVVIVT